MKAASIQTPLVKSCSHLSIRHQEQCLVYAQETKYYLNSQWSNIILSHVSTASITERLEQQVNGKEFFSQQNLHCFVTYNSRSYFLIKISSSSQILSWTTSSACPNIVASKVSSPSRLASVDRIVAT